jgi:hypothetical protein
MTISTQYLPLSYAGDGVTNSFPVTFPYQSSIQIVVATKVVSTGVVTPAVYGTDFTVSPTLNSPASTGTVTWLSGALPVGTDILISRATPDTQDTRWVPNDPNPSTSTENAVDKLTMIAQEQEYQIQNIPGGGGGAAIVTTAVFAMATVNSSQTVAVNTITGLAVGNNVQISNVVNTLVGQITSINVALLQITVKTLAITAGVAGNNMPVGSPVQLGTVPALPTTITAQDVVIGPSSVGAFTFTGDSTLAAASLPVGRGSLIDLYIVPPLTGQNAHVKGYFNTLVSPEQLGRGYVQSGGSVLVSAGNAANGVVSEVFDFVGQQVLTTDVSGNPQWSQITTPYIANNTVTPPLLLATNSPANTQIPSYDSASGNFKWVNPGGSGSLPGGGTVGNFLRGDVAWSHVLNTSSIEGFVLANAETDGTYGTIISNYNTTPSPFHWNTVIGQTLRTAGTWGLAVGGMGVLAFPTMITEVGSASNYQQLETPNREALQTLGLSTSIIRADGLRTTHGPWQFAYPLPSTSGAITLFLINGAYQRQASVTGPITYTLSDTTSAPTLSGWQFASELTVEINAPGANAITWPGNITWANGGSAPTLNGAGINIVRLIRRQGLTQWVGYVEGGTFSLTAGIINSTTYFAATSVPVAALVNGGSTPDATKFYRGDGTWQVPSGAIAAQNLGSPISGGPFTTLNFNSNISAINAGAGTLQINSAGGGGTPPSPNGFVIQWNGVQTWTGNNSFSGINTFSNREFFNRTFAGLGASTIGVNVNAAFSDPGTPILYADACGVTVSIMDTYTTPPSGGGIRTGDFRRSSTTSHHGGNNFYIGNDLWGSLTDGFSICFAQVGQARIMTGGNCDGVWLNSYSPCNLFSSSPDPNGIVHNWTTGAVRVGEVNYGNAWVDWGLVESLLAAGASHYSGGLTFAPDWEGGGQLGMSTDLSHHYDAQWAIAIVYAGPDHFGHAPQNHIGILVDENAISPQGYCLRLTGSHGTFNGTSETANCTHAIIKAAGSTNIGIDFAGTYDDNRQLIVVPETTTGHSNQPAIQLVGGQAICLRPPTGANTGTYIMDDGTHLRATRDGGNTWTPLI